MADPAMGRFLIAAGVVLIALGLLSYVMPLLRLPGDIRYEGEHFKFYFPLMTCIIISIILTIVFYFLKK
jgi:hypothetical protein